MATVCKTNKFLTAQFFWLRRDNSVWWKIQDVWNFLLVRLMRIKQFDPLYLLVLNIPNIPPIPPLSAATAASLAMQQSGISHRRRWFCEKNRFFWGNASQVCCRTVMKPTKKWLKFMLNHWTWPFKQQKLGQQGPWTILVNPPAKGKWVIPGPLYPSIANPIGKAREHIDNRWTDRGWQMIDSLSKTGHVSKPTTYIRISANKSNIYLCMYI